MKRTLDSFQQEWFELKTRGELDMDQMPEIPKVYKENIDLSNVLTQLQKEVDEARIIAEKSRLKQIALEEARLEAELLKQRQDQEDAENERR